MNLRERDNALEELLDAPVADPGVLARNLRDIRRINLMLGWTSLALKQVAHTLAARQLQTFSLLDVATGSADIPKAIARWAQRQRLQAKIIATDISEQILDAARTTCAGISEIQLEQQNALALSYADHSFDLVLCSMAFHHFSPEDAPTLLRELARVARHAVIVSDLQRSLPAYTGAWLLTHTLMPNRLTRHDAPASVRRAYTANEVCALAEQAGLHEATIRTVFPFRQIMVWERQQQLP
ncbi:MAG TPA: methyltransferase domain-containing protein [Ktedonobacterales bacterium]|nr:methyltransferase domain-containing protein [Ktedonobacterales bacterium]